MSFSPVLAFYRAASSVLGAFAGLYLNGRAKRGKEDPARVGERFGRYTQTRPAGPAVWVHAASIGESGVALALIEALATQNAALSFVLTTGTRTSAELVARRAPARTTHVYVPLDRADCVRRFLDRWEKMYSDAAQPGETGKQGARELDDALKSLGLRPQSNKVRGTDNADDNLRDKDVSASRPPEEYERLFRAYNRATRELKKAP